MTDLDRRPIKRRRLSLFGLEFDALSTEAVHWAVRSRAPGAPFTYVVTPNVDHVVRLAHAPRAVKAAYEGAWLCINDSRVLQRLAGMLGIDMPTAPGSDLVAALMCDPDLPRDTPIMVVGGTPELVDRLRRFCGLANVMHHEPPMGLRDNPAAMAEAVEAVVAARAEYVLLAIGSPQQELLAAEVARDPRTKGVGLCIGAGLEFLVGAKRRAPALLQRYSLEWAFRLLSEPRRLWKRYLVDGLRIIPLFLAERRRLKMEGH